MQWSVTIQKRHYLEKFCRSTQASCAQIVQRSTFHSVYFNYKKYYVCKYQVASALIFILICIELWRFWLYPCSFVGVFCTRPTVSKCWQQDATVFWGNLVYNCQQYWTMLLILNQSTTRCKNVEQYCWQHWTMLFQQHFCIQFST